MISGKLMCIVIPRQSRVIKWFIYDLLRNVQINVQCRYHQNQVSMYSYKTKLELIKIHKYIICINLITYRNKNKHY